MKCSELRIKTNATADSLLLKGQMGYWGQYSTYSRIYVREIEVYKNTDYLSGTLKRPNELCVRARAHATYSS